MGNVAADLGGFTTPSGGITRLSQLWIDADKAWPAPWVGTHAPAWALAPWLYRKRFTVTNATAGLLTDYQVKLRIYSDYGVDSGNTIYTNGLVENDFDDLRFTNNAGALLSYWIESISLPWADVWVRLDSVPVGTTDFWIYFGNPAAAAVSSGPGTFIIFNPGDSIVGWTDVTIAASGNIDWAVNAGKIRGISSAINAAAYLFCDTVTGIDSYKFHVHILAQDGLIVTDYRQGIVHHVAQDNVAGGYAAWKDVDNKWWVWDEVPLSTSSLADATFDARVDHEYILRRTPTQSQLFVDSALKVTHLCGAWSPQTVGLYARMAAAAHWVDFYNIYVANYADPEPVVSDSGSLESYYEAYGITNLAELAAGMVKGDMLVFDGTRLIITTPGPIGSQLTSKDFGNLPAWEFAP